MQSRLKDGTSHTSQAFQASAVLQTVGFGMHFPRPKGRGYRNYRHSGELCLPGGHIIPFKRIKKKGLLLLQQPLLYGALARTRNADQLIKSQLLYRLSYEGFFN